jgi:hypothetical protein
MRRPLQARRSQLDELGELTREQARLVALDAASLTVAAVSGWCLFAEALHPDHPSAALLAFAAAYPLGLAVWSLAQRFPLPPGAVVVDPAAKLAGLDRWNLSFSRVTVIGLAFVSLVSFPALMLRFGEGEALAVPLAATNVVLATLLFAVIRVRRAAFALALTGGSFAGTSMGWARAGASVQPLVARLHLGVLVVLVIGVVLSVGMSLFVRAELRLLQQRAAALRERAEWGNT